MGLINYKDIDFNQSINKENKTINFNGSEIQIVNYLSINDKNDFITATLKKSYEDNIYNPIKLELYFNLHLVYLYTNIVFSTEDRTNEEDLYDNLKRSGLLNIIKENIPKEELKELEEMLRQFLKTYKEYNYSITGFLSNLLDDALDKFKNSLGALKDINPELISAVLKENPQLTELVQQIKDKNS